MSTSTSTTGPGSARCADPGTRLVDACTDPGPGLRARALRALGELGRGDLRGLCMQALQDEEPAGRVQAAAAAVLRGDRGHALDVLQACVPNTSANAAPPPPSISAC